MKVIYLFVLLGCLSCVSYNTPEKSDNYLSIAEGGGFTGVVKTWYLADNGQIFFNSSSDTTIQLVSRTKKKNSRQVFKKASKLFSEDKKWPTEPANFYRKVEFHHLGKVHSAVWIPGDSSYAVLDSFYRYSSGIIASQHQ